METIWLRGAKLHSMKLISALFSPAATAIRLCHQLKGPYARTNYDTSCLLEHVTFRLGENFRFHPPLVQVSQPDNTFPQNYIIYEYTESLWIIYSQRTLVHAVRDVIVLAFLLQRSYNILFMTTPGAICAVNNSCRAGHISHLQTAIKASHQNILPASSCAAGPSQQIPPWSRPFVRKYLGFWVLKFLISKYR